MKKLKILLAALLVIGSTAKAQVVYGENEKEYIKASSFSNGRTEKKDSKPFLSGQEKYKLSSIGSNWFGSIKAGMSTFSGAPVGCTDFFGHTRPTMVFSLGKWHSRFFGTRLVYQGFKFTNAIDEAMKFQNYHGDLMLNVSSFYRTTYDPLPRWDLVPYIGAGVIHNSELHHIPFALSYGLLCSYRATNRLHVTAELGGTSTYQKFDGLGKNKHFGDNLFQATVGLTIGIGKQGYERKPVLEVLDTDNQGVTDLNNYPKNSFDGLRKLRDRMASEEQAVENSGIQLDAPILFFFKINSTNLVDKQQLVNIGEIAGAVKENNLSVKIIGAADSKTGTPKHNRALSVKRAKYIAKLLMKAGVDKSKMQGISRGGINLYKPYTANRHTCVIVYKEETK